MTKLLDRILYVFAREEIQHRRLMAAIDTLNSNIVALTAAVTAVVSYDQTGATEAQVQSAADAVAAQTAKLVAIVTPPAPTA